MSDQRAKADLLRGKRALAKAEGKCIACMKVQHMPGLDFCGPCRERSLAMRAAAKSGVGKSRAARQAARLCIRCGGGLDPTSTIHCAVHLEKAREYQRRSDAKKRTAKVAAQAAASPAWAPSPAPVVVPVHRGHPRLIAVGIATSLTVALALLILLVTR